MTVQSQAVELGGGNYHLWIKLPSFFFFVTSQDSFQEQFIFHEELSLNIHHHHQLPGDSQEKLFDF